MNGDQGALLGRTTQWLEALLHLVELGHGPLELLLHASMIPSALVQSHDLSNSCASGHVINFWSTCPCGKADAQIASSAPAIWTCAAPESKSSGWLHRNFREG